MSSERKRVYVVDDDKSILDSMSFLLDSYGYTVETFDDPLRFLDASSELAPGCVIIDLSMPGCDGFKLYTQLIKRGVWLPALMISGHADERAESRALTLGVHAFLRKPVDTPLLLDCLESLLGTDSERPNPA